MGGSGKAAQGIRIGIAVAILFLFPGAFAHSRTIGADNTSATSQPAPVLRHPLEIRALVDPQSVLRALPPLLKHAEASGDWKEQALLRLAQANACRVVANWPCQIQAGAGARVAAEKARLPELEVRALIAESRGRIAMQDFTRGERLLGRAQRILESHPAPEMRADVFLAYSSLSYTLGKHAAAAEYARRGLDALGLLPAPTERIRLLRNQANALAQLGQTDEAQQVVERGLKLLEQIDDPKLGAELYLEDARIARMKRDVPTQLSNGQRILELGSRLGNSQLTGIGHEVLGLAALDAPGDKATRELDAAYRSFRQLGLARDERRVLRALISQTLARGNDATPATRQLTERLIQLETELDESDHRLAADDFDARLKYEQQEFEVLRLQSGAALAVQRERTLAYQQRFALALAASSLVLLGVLAGFYVFQRRAGARLQRVNRQLRESEQRYRMLAENSRDLVVRMRLDGKRMYVSPAARDLLGMEPAELEQTRWDLVHPDDRDQLVSALSELGKHGGSATITYRARHHDGHYVSIEALGRRVDNPEDGGPAEIVYSGRDVTARVRAEEALSKSESRMRAITDNIPAMIAHIDAQERYQFANALTGSIFGVEPQTMIGRTVREVRGEAIYADIKPEIDAALRGETTNFFGKSLIDGLVYHYQSSFVPDRDASGRVQGFFSLTFDITQQKAAEEALDRLARVDSLTGVANRRQFEERLASALAHGRRQDQSIALLWLDIDHFKAINDTHGHPVGDAVLLAVAHRLLDCVREGDLVARLGGDEFMVLIVDPKAGAADAVAAKLMETMREPVAAGPMQLQVRVSIGVASSRMPVSETELLSLVDKALYQAKSEGRDTWRALHHPVPADVR